MDISGTRAGTGTAETMQSGTGRHWACWAVAEVPARRAGAQGPRLRLRAGLAGLAGLAGDG